MNKFVELNQNEISSVCGGINFATIGYHAGMMIGIPGGSIVSYGLFLAVTKYHEQLPTQNTYCLTIARIVAIASSVIGSIFASRGFTRIFHAVGKDIDNFLFGEKE